MKQILLSKQGKNKGLFVALVDDEDFEHVNHFRWNVQKNGNTYYAIRHITVDGKRTTQTMQGFILEAKEVDHIHGDGLNNQRSNIRKCTHQQNQMNQKPYKNTTSIYKGVSWSSGMKKWCVQITLNGYTFRMGYFVDEIEAAKVYDIAAKEHFGEFAYLNFKN